MINLEITDIFLLCGLQWRLANISRELVVAVTSTIWDEKQVECTLNWRHRQPDMYSPRIRTEMRATKMVFTRQMPWCIV